ncbi:MAG: archaemetzincin [Pyrinomonadaceae bacterium]
MKKLWVLTIALFFCGCFQQAQMPKVETPPSQIARQNSDERITKLVKIKQAIVPFFKPMGMPQKNDWLATFKEPGQTFEEYVGSNPVLPTAERRTIYIEPIGKFSATEREVLSLTAEFMRAFYNLPVVLKTEEKLENVPEELTRKNLYTKQTQIETTYFLKNLLPKIIPADAAALVCFTDADLFPASDWSFVFGEASLQNRVGVWSFYRLGNPEKSEKDYKLFLARTLKIAMHETGHIFSMHHCTKYECLMSGTNNLQEIDRRPPDVCPECMAKIAWAMNYEPAERYKNLANFCGRHGLVELSKEFKAKEKAVRQITN